MLGDGYKEKRKAKRMTLDATIRLKNIGEDAQVAEMTVEVVNLSRGGLALKSSQKLPLNTYYDVRIVMENKDIIEAVIEIIREETMEDAYLYGCRFIGINPVEQFKIDVYEILSET